MTQVELVVGTETIGMGVLPEAPPVGDMIEWKTRAQQNAGKPAGVYQVASRMWRPVPLGVHFVAAVRLVLRPVMEQLYACSECGSFDCFSREAISMNGPIESLGDCQDYWCRSCDQPFKMPLNAVTEADEIARLQKENHVAPA